MLRLALLLLLLPLTSFAQMFLPWGNLIALAIPMKEAPAELIDYPALEPQAAKAYVKAYADSIHQLTWQINQHRDSSVLYLRRGVARVEMGLAAEGKQDLLTAREHKVKYRRMDMALAKAHFQLAAREAALAALERQIAVTPADPEPYYYRAVVELYHHPSRYSAGLHERATRAMPELDRTLKAFPDLAKAQRMRGYVQLVLDHPAEATADLTAVVTAHPDDDLARLLLSRALLKQGQKSAACEQLQQLRTVDAKEQKKLLKEACST